MRPGPSGPAAANLQNRGLQVRPCRPDRKAPLSGVLCCPRRRRILERVRTVSENAAKYPFPGDSGLGARAAGARRNAETSRLSASSGRRFRTQRARSVADRRVGRTRGPLGRSGRRRRFWQPTAAPHRVRAPSMIERDQIPRHLTPPFLGRLLRPLTPPFRRHSETPAQSTALAGFDGEEPDALLPPLPAGGSAPMRSVPSDQPTTRQPVRSAIRNGHAPRR